MEKLKPKLFSVMKTYTKEQLIKDIIAGIIVAIIALPVSIALALASGVTPEKGIYTAIIAGFLISFFGGSRVQISGPTAAFATIVAGIVAKNGMEGLVVATIMAGIILIRLLEKTVRPFSFGMKRPLQSIQIHIMAAIITIEVFIRLCHKKRSII